MSANRHRKHNQMDLLAKRRHQKMANKAAAEEGKTTAAALKWFMGCFLGIPAIGTLLGASAHTVGGLQLLGATVGFLAAVIATLLLT